MAGYLADAPEPVSTTPRGDATPDPDLLRLLVLIGSTRPGRFGPVVAGWFAAHARRRGDFVVEVVDLADLAIPSDVLRAAVDAADAVVIVTPEYNHSFPGPLKTAIDSLRPEWHAKPVGFVSYGGISGGLRAVEALRPVFAELHAVTVRETVSVAWAWNCFDAGGVPHDQPALAAAADRLLDQLGWWAVAVRAGRDIRAYVG